MFFAGVVLTLKIDSSLFLQNGVENIKRVCCLMWVLWMCTFRKVVFVKALSMCGNMLVQV